MYSKKYDFNHRDTLKTGRKNKSDMIKYEL